MREKLNDNPVAQVAVLGVLALIVGFLLITRMGGGSEETVTPPATTATTPTDTTATPVTPTDPTAPPADTGTTPVAPTTPTTPGAGSDFKAGPGLPESVVNAWNDNKVVTLLVYNKGSIDDEKLKSIAQPLHQRGDVAFFQVEAKDIADYSRIAQGVDLQQTPALVVLIPKDRTKGPQPTAFVEYGFRGPASVLQAVEDALYKGRTDLPYYPK